MASRSLEDLLPPVRYKAVAFEKACRAKGLDVLIYCTYRSDEEQEALYALGRNANGVVIDQQKVVTNAKGGDSFHNHRCAWDFVPLVGGKPAWNDKAKYQQCGEIAESLGISWSGRWKGTLKETAHCQYTGGLTLAEIKAGKEIK